MALACFEGKCQVRPGGQWPHGIPVFVAAGGSHGGTELDGDARCLGVEPAADGVGGHEPADWSVGRGRPHAVLGAWSLAHVQESAQPYTRLAGLPDRTVRRCDRACGEQLLHRELNNLATGLKLTVRDVAPDELTEQEGMERLAAHSYFARLLDQCWIR